MLVQVGRVAGSGASCLYDEFAHAVEPGVAGCGRRLERVRRFDLGFSASVEANTRNLKLPPGPDAPFSLLSFTPLQGPAGQDGDDNQEQRELGEAEAQNGSERSTLRN